MDKVKVIFFDMGNTLLHFHCAKTDEEKDMKGLIHLTEYLNKLNTEITFKDVKENFFDKWMEGIKDRKTTYKEYPIEKYLNGFLDKYDVKLDLNQCIEAINLFYTEYRENLFFEDNLIDTLKYLKNKGYIISIISNTCYYDEVMKECFKKVGIYDLIDDFTFSYSIRLGKPNIEIFNEAIKKVGISPNECIMVGDSLDKDIKPAIDLGMKTIWLNLNEEINDSIEPDIEIKSLNDINKLF